MNASVFSTSLRARSQRAYEGGGHRYVGYTTHKDAYWLALSLCQFDTTNSFSCPVCGSFAEAPIGLGDGCSIALQKVNWRNPAPRPQCSLHPRSRVGSDSSLRMLLSLPTRRMGLRLARARAFSRKQRRRGDDEDGALTKPVPSEVRRIRHVARPADGCATLQEYQRFLGTLSQGSDAWFLEVLLSTVTAGNDNEVCSRADSWCMWSIYVTGGV